MNQFLRLSVHRCLENCVDEQQISDFMKFHRTAFLQALSYVDFEDVVALDGHIKTTILDVESQPLPLTDGTVMKFSLIES